METTITLNEQQVDFLRSLFEYGIFDNEKSSATEIAIANAILTKLNEEE